MIHYSGFFFLVLHFKHTHYRFSLFSNGLHNFLLNLLEVRSSPLVVFPSSFIFSTYSLLDCQDNKLIMFEIFLSIFYFTFFLQKLHLQRIFIPVLKDIIFLVVYVCVFVGHYI